MRERIDLSSDITVLVAQLRRLAATRIGKRLGIGELVLVDPTLAQVIIDIDAAISAWGDYVASEEGIEPDELREEWEYLKRRIIRKASLLELRRLSENTRIFVAASDEAKRGEDD